MIFKLNPYLSGQISHTVRIRTHCDLKYISNSIVFQNISSEKEFSDQNYFICEQKKYLLYLKMTLLHHLHGLRLATKLQKPQVVLV